MSYQLPPIKIVYGPAVNRTNDPPKPKKVKKNLTAVEYGKLGGAITRQRYGSDHYAKIGRKGGNHTRKFHAEDGFYKKIGKMGGEKCKKNHTERFYKWIGRKGGQVVKEAFAELAARRAADPKPDDAG